MTASAAGIRQSLVDEAIKWGGMAKFRHRNRWARFFYRTALALDARSVLARRMLGTVAVRAVQLPDLNYVSIGTTGTCNASCVHCPTGKAITANSPRGTMSMEIFRKIIDGILDEGIHVKDQIGFGLFGDGLVDPLVVERAKYLRAALPDVVLTINTNGAAFNAAKHAVLNDYASVVTLHCESLTPETYDYLMAPLRAKNVHQKYEPILAAFPGKVVVSVPVTRANLPELPALRDWFMARGAHRVIFDPMASRCVEDTTIFDQLSLNPAPIRCPSSIMADLIVDCDGVVINCCQDFTRIEPIGDLSKETLAETMQSIARKMRERQLAEGRHGEIATCSRCFGDARTPDFPFDQAIPEQSPRLARELETAQ